MNTSGSTIPAGGCFRVSQVNGTTSLTEIRYSAIKPDGEPKFYFINGPVPALSGKTLFADQGYQIVRALVDWTDPGVAFGETVGPVNGAWALDTSAGGFEVIGTIGSDGLTPVKTSGGGSGGANWLVGSLAYDCAYGTMEVTMNYGSVCAAQQPEMNGRVAEDVKDPLLILGGMTEAELNSSEVRIDYAVDWDDCSGTTGRWVVMAVTGLNHCETAL